MQVTLHGAVTLSFCLSGTRRRGKSMAGGGEAAESEALEVSGAATTPAHHGHNTQARGLHLFSIFLLIPLRLFYRFL